MDFHNNLETENAIHHNNTYSVNGICDNKVADHYSKVFTSAGTSNSTTTLDIIYDFKQPILANHLKAWPNSYSTGHQLIGSFVIYGSNDNSTWSSLGSQTWTSSDYGFLNPQPDLTAEYTASDYRNLAASFDFNTDRQSYQYYKISVSSDQFGVNVSTVSLYIGEVALYTMGSGIQFLEERIINIERVLNIT